jgi:hypothetical protein
MMRFQKLLTSTLVLSILFSVACAHQGKVETHRQPNDAGSIQGAPVIADPSIYSQVIVMSDTHGMYDNLLTLLHAGAVIDGKNNWSAGKSLLIVTGDSIDKGAKSIEVISLWISLQQQAAAVGGRVIHTLGNHEAEFLANPDPSNKKAAELIAEMQSLRIPLSDLTTTSTPRGQFIHSEPVALRVGNWLFCHSGFYPEMAWNDFSSQADQVLSSQNYGDDFLIGDDSILESKKWELDAPTVNSMLGRFDSLGVFGVVFGHQPGAFGIKGRSAAKYQGRLIKIDNGMAPEAGSNPGSLLVFTSPAQMKTMSYPSIKIIYPDGSQKALRPE